MDDNWREVSGGIFTDTLIAVKTVPDGGEDSGCGACAFFHDPKRCGQSEEVGQSLPDCITHDIYFVEVQDG